MPVVIKLAEVILPDGDEVFILGLRAICDHLQIDVIDELKARALGLSVMEAGD